MKEEVCVDCGIHFGLPEEVEPLWRKVHKVFYCPNGHSLQWSIPTPEVDTLRKEIKELREKLEMAQEEATKQKKRIEELLLELEIWKPSEKTA